MEYVTFSEWSEFVIKNPYLVITLFDLSTKEKR